MPIDWFTVTAQILNFVVLVWILKRFLYRPVLKMMDERRGKAEEENLAASREKEKAVKERSALAEKNRVLEKERKAILSAAAQEAEAERARLMEEARKEYEELRERWQKSLIREQEDLKQEITTHVQSESIAIATQMVKDLADAEFLECLVRKFIQQLDDFMPGKKNALPAFQGKSDNKDAVLRSSFDLSDSLRAKIESAVGKVTGKVDRPLCFEKIHSQDTGIELTINGQKIGWTISSYTDSLSSSLQELIRRETEIHEQGQE